MLIYIDIDSLYVYTDIYLYIYIYKYAHLAQRVPIEGMKTHRLERRRNI